MKKVRIQKDIDVRWVIFVNGIEQDITSFDLYLELTDAYGRTRNIEDFTINNGNIIEFSLYGKDFHTLGKYILSLYVNKDKPGQSVLDYRYAFELVKYTDQEEDEIDGDLDINETVELSGNLDSFTQGEVIGDYVSRDQLDNILDGYAQNFLKPEDVSNFVTEADLTLDQYVKNSSLTANYPTRNDVSQFVSNTSVSQTYAKKQDISVFVTNNQLSYRLENFLTESDIENFISMDDVTS